MKIENQQRIGIVGGMGPMAGVLLQKLIIEATPAARDQDHLQVICFTNPQIPDRTTSLQEDGGASYLEAVIETAQTLYLAGATILIIPCNTAHARFDDLQRVIPLPILNIVELTAKRIAEQYGGAARIGLLATDGTIQAGLYQKVLGRYGIICAVPSEENQKKVMQAIYTIKAGNHNSALRLCRSAIKELMRGGGQYILLGCTELSLCFEEIQKAKYTVVDPLRIVAQLLVEDIHQPTDLKVETSEKMFLRV